MSNENRNDSIIVEAIAASPGIAWFDVKSGALGQAFDSLVPAVLSAFLAFVGGMAAGQWLVPSPETARIAIAGIAAWLSFNGLYLIDRRLSAPRYRAEYGNEVGEEEETEQDAMIPTADRGRLVRLDDRMRRLLHTFARNYPKIKTLGINRWEGRGRPFDNRDEIQDLRAYLVNIGAADKGGGNRVTLNDFGEAQIPKWAVRDFGDVVQLSPTPERD